MPGGGRAAFLFGLPCRNPGQARPSMEAPGIDVLATARVAGLPFFLQGEEVVYTGLVLIE
ncbi:hypothetical protein GFC01_16805 [Desulfofundulus thermobenzoicus]|uniref:Uncharacterized protein n=1 Tax=Desulfofundulus thermobenzoicus TaxID=29376 RepID=A0A6N7IUT9_9FIRM|nr:hypothetical protein [Desulfofundulus thermobenzoicus]